MYAVLDYKLTKYSIVSSYKTKTLRTQKSFISSQLTDSVTAINYLSLVKKKASVRYFDMYKTDI